MKKVFFNFSEEYIVNVPHAITLHQNGLQLSQSIGFIRLVTNGMLIFQTPSFEILKFNYLLFYYAISFRKNWLVGSVSLA